MTTLPHCSAISENTFADQISGGSPEIAIQVRRLLVLKLAFQGCRDKKCDEKVGFKRALEASSAIMEVTLVWVEGGGIVMWVLRVFLGSGLLLRMSTKEAFLGPVDVGVGEEVPWAGLVKPSLHVVSVALTLNYVAPLEVVLNPLANGNVRSRFEVFTTYVHITRDHDFEDGELFGCIQVSDHYGLLPDGWVLDLDPGHVSLLDHDWRHFVKMQNNGRLKICNPSSPHSIPFSSSMQICMLSMALQQHDASLYRMKCIRICHYPRRLTF
ncbi:hypothetical protein Tco_0303881 [Tanacetum coccineum]